MLEGGENVPSVRRFLLNGSEGAEVDAYGALFENTGEIALQRAGGEAELWPSREKLLMHKPITADDIIWWDEPPMSK